MADNVEEADPAQEKLSRFASLQCNEPLAGSVSEKCFAIYLVTRLLRPTLGLSQATEADPGERNARRSHARVRADRACSAAATPVIQPPCAVEKSC